MKKIILTFIIKTFFKDKDGRIDLSDLDLTGFDVFFSGLKANKIYNGFQKADFISNLNQVAIVISNKSQKSKKTYNSWQQSNKIDNEFQEAFFIRNKNQKIK